MKPVTRCALGCSEAILKSIPIHVFLKKVYFALFPNSLRSNALHASTKLFYLTPTAMAMLSKSKLLCK